MSITHQPHAKFSDPTLTARGEPRATVAFDELKTLWINTGTLCNITCAHCYIESSPTNDSLVYFTEADLAPFLEEVSQLGGKQIEIGFTGGEPFLNPQILGLVEMALARGHRVLILTNAMRPMMRPRMRDGLRALKARYGERITLRVSLDHYDADLHDEERGAGSFDATLNGIDWLAQAGFKLSLAGRSLWGGDEAEIRAGFARLIAARDWPIDARSAEQLVLFPEMDASAEVPEISDACWGILKVAPAAMMCASARMVVKRKGAEAPSVIACTLLPYEPEFELAARLTDSLTPVALNHPHCAKFCVLGGGSCSA
ncbi:MAG: radical SAM protein [Hyphomonadaceae bacterium JAD_PAG50586_4]|nr:MAG: radical SAM protein [Hyphomonadaceae bacterium JAD_PAG50586_4]